MNEQEKWSNIRWGATVVYLSAVFLMVGLLFLFPSLETVLGIAVMLVSIIGIVPLFIVINIPYIRMHRSERTPPKRTVISSMSERRGRPAYIDSVRMNLLIWIIVPMNIFILAVSFVLMDIVLILIMLPFVLLLSLALLFFWKLDIGADDRTVWFYYGPIGRTLLFSDIRSIQAMEVHAVRDFMGWGWRSGSDGSIGYISNSKEGVKIVTKGGRTYTVTCHRPEELVRGVRKGIRR
jgi:hypothetical protein